VRVQAVVSALVAAKSEAAGRAAGVAKVQIHHLCSYRLLIYLRIEAEPGSNTLGKPW
jgi:hypothetical protein